MNEFLHILPTWGFLVSLSLCIGTLVCRLGVLAPGTEGEVTDHTGLVARLWSLLALSIALIALCSIAGLVGRAAEMSGYPVRTVLPLLPAVVLKTHFGKIWLIRMAALALFAVLVVSGEKYRNARLYLSLLLVVATVIAFTHSATGHAADSGDFSIAELVDLLHLAGSLIWAGGLFVLSLIIVPGLSAAGDLAARTLADAAARFSRFAGIAVGFIVITSLYNAWAYIGSLDAIFKTPYGQTIIAKITFFILILVLAAYNRYFIIPQLHQAAVRAASTSTDNRSPVSLAPSEDRGSKREAIASIFLRTVRREAFLMLGLLFCVSFLRHEVPARHNLHAGHAQTAVGHATHEHEGDKHQNGLGPETFVHIETAPRKIVAMAPVSMKVYLEDADKRPLRGLMTHHDRIVHAVIIGKDLNVFAHIHPEDNGPVTNEMLKKAVFPLQYTFPKAGEYIIGLDFATEEGHYSKRIPLVVSGRPSMGEPKFDISTEKDFGPYQVILRTSPRRIRPNTDILLRFLIQKNNKPVTDLGPYLGAPMHLAVVRKDLTEFIHTHGSLPGVMHSRDEGPQGSPPERFGPEIDASVVFPMKGIYKIFSEVKHDGKILLFDFMVEVEQK
jgi:putative copper resistance protein D